MYPGVLYMRDGRVSCNITVLDEDENKEGMTLSADNVRDVLKKLYIMMQASVENMADKFFEIKISKGLHVLLKRFYAELSDKELDEIDDIVISLYEALFNPAETVTDIKDNLIKFDFGF